MGFSHASLFHFSHCVYCGQALKDGEPFRILQLGSFCNLIIPFLVPAYLALDSHKFASGPIHTGCGAPVKKCSECPAVRYNLNAWCSLQVFRVYYDRLTEDSDRTWLFNFLREVTKNQLKEDFDQMLYFLDYNSDGKVLCSHRDNSV